MPAEPPVIEPPKQEPLGKISDAYDQALKAVQDKSKPDHAAPPEKETPKKEEVAEPEKKVESEKAKPASALDAVLEKKGEEAKKPEEQRPELSVDELPTNTPAAPLRAALKRREQEIQKLKGDLEKASAGDPITKQELATLKEDREKLAAENSKLRDSIAAISVDYDPAVREKYVDGKAKLLERAVKFIEEYGGDVKAFSKAMKLTGKDRTAALKEALSEVDETDRPAIYAKLEKVRELEEEHADLLANSQKSYEKLTKAQQERARQEHSQAEQAKNTIAEKVLKSLPSRHPMFNEAPAESEGADDYNTRLKADMEKAAYLRSADADWNEISEASAKAARFDFLEETHLEYRQTAQAEIAQLKEQLAKYEGSEPGFTGGKKPAGPSKLEKTPGEVYAETMAAMSAKEV